MLVKATTDAAGNLTLQFPASGEYKLSFGQGVASAAMQLDYTVKRPASTARQTPLHNKIDNSELTVTIPAGGGTLSDALRSINESGLGSDPALKKGRMKK